MKTIGMRLLVIVLLVSLALSSCTPAQPAGPAPLKVAVLPVIDSLPMYVAQQEGFFEKRGVKVEFVPVASAAERDQLLVVGQADGMINEVVSTLFFNKEKTQVQIVRYARAATAQDALFRLLAAKDSALRSPQDLKGVPVGVSEGTVIAYLTDRLLAAEGLEPADIQTIAVPKIPDRMALLASGELKAAMLPDPLSSLALQQGAVLILDDTRHPELSYSTIAFRKSVLEQNPEGVRAFLAAIEDATQAINKDTTRWKDLLAANKLVPVPLLESYQVPPFVTAGVPTQAQYNDALAWSKGKGLLARDISYGECVTGEYLPNGE